MFRLIIKPDLRMFRLIIKPDLYMFRLIIKPDLYMFRLIIKPNLYNEYICVCARTLHTHSGVARRVSVENSPVLGEHGQVAWWQTCPPNPCNALLRAF